MAIQKQVSLNWSRLLGFDQLSKPSETDDRSGVKTLGLSPRISGKIGRKGPRIGAKLSTKIGTKIGVKIGAKIGAKVGFKSVSGSRP